MRKARSRSPAQGKARFPLGRLLKERRLNRYQFAARSGIALPVVCRLARPSANPTWQTVQRVARALGLRVLFVPEGGAT